MRVVPLDNGTGGSTRFGDVDAFQRLASRTSAVLAAAATEFQRGWVLYQDIPFFAAAAAWTGHPGWSATVLPRSSGALHARGDQRRVEWERSMLLRACTRGVCVGAISMAMHDHLVHDVGVPAPAMADLFNGLTDADAVFDPLGGDALLSDTARQGFVLAMGRAVPRKGFEDLLAALGFLRAGGAALPPVVLAAVSESSTPTGYQRYLAEEFTRLAPGGVFVSRFTPGVRDLLAHRALRALVVPSRVEPFGRIPLEAYAAGACPVVATTAGGLAELVRDGVTGHTARPADPRSLAGALRRALNCSPAHREDMRAAGRTLLSRYDYTATVRAHLAVVAAWALDPTTGHTGSSHTVRRHPGCDARTRVRVLQIPEVCEWNPYVADLEAALRRRGAVVLHPGSCRDVPGTHPPSPASPPRTVPVDVVHLHWPEKLAHLHGPARAVDYLRALKRQGAVITQTVHNLTPHEPDRVLTGYLHSVDALTDAVHFFSADHERLARTVRPLLPGYRLHQGHPTAPPRQTMGAPDGPRVGCLGRIRGYKCTAEFAEVFLRGALPAATLLVAGAPDSLAADAQLRRLATQFPGRLDYRPGFISAHHEFEDLLHQVDWVALPYRILHSSGVLVAALRAGRRILSPEPVGGRALYGTYAGSQEWLALDPWDDEHAVTLWNHRTPVPGPVPITSRLHLPTWDDAAAGLLDLAATAAQALRNAPIRPDAHPAPLGVV
ncbi:MAG: glycosyltransferase [Actinobacteria bacterium]|nr:glycosyltransferase [Actinomycetota bacterium]MBI3687750.1 glycosyltransferase [Actinomycetota bacterium]